MTSRRDALLSVLAALAAACRPSADTLRLVTGTNPTAGDHRLLVALGLDDIAFSALIEHAPTRNQLAQILSECRPRCQELSTLGTDGEVRATLCRWIAEDFACGALTAVDGWQLARSEAMILALLAAQRA
jgi:hypothetical protein